MKPVIIIAIVIPIVIALIAVLVIPSMQQQNIESNTDEKQRDEIIWQTLQKTYLMQECREKYIGQADEMEKCFEQIDEEQRLNPPTSPSTNPSHESVKVECDESYPDVCIPYPPDLDCDEISYSHFRVIGDDPYGFDGNNDGIGCAN